MMTSSSWNGRLGKKCGSVFWKEATKRLYDYSSVDISLKRIIRNIFSKINSYEQISFYVMGRGAKTEFFVNGFITFTEFVLCNGSIL